MPDQELSAPQIDDRHPDFVSFLHVHVSRGNECLFRVLVVEELEFGLSTVCEAPGSFVSIAEPLKNIEGFLSDFRGICKKVELEVDLGAIHIA